MQSFVQELEPLPHEDANLLPQLQQLESTLSGCAREASKDQVFVRMGYMASELKRLASKVHKNEQRTSSCRWVRRGCLFFHFFSLLFFYSVELGTRLQLGMTEVFVPGGHPGGV